MCEYDPGTAASSWRELASVGAAAKTIERYLPWLPVSSVPGGFFDGVGATTVAACEALSSELDVEVLVQSEAGNPSGSFKDRGLGVAIALGTALGAQRFCLPTQGNAGVAAALFSSRMGLPRCLVWMPVGHRRSFYHRAAEHYGAEVVFFGSNIAEAGAEMRQRYAEELSTGALVDTSTFLEPGRLEGKKTLGLQIFEHFGDPLPDVIVYPTGGGTGLVGIWKAFEELRAAGVLREAASLPRMVAVQSEQCDPVVRAFAAGDTQVHPVQSRGTIADGLNVPGAIMGHEILRALRESGGVAVGVGEADIERGFDDLARRGIAAGMEGGATLAALRKLRAEGAIASGARVLLLVTSGPWAALHARAG